MRPSQVDSHWVRAVVQPLRQEGATAVDGAASDATGAQLSGSATLEKAEGLIEEGEVLFVEAMRDCSSQHCTGPQILPSLAIVE